MLLKMFSPACYTISSVMYMDNNLYKINTQTLGMDKADIHQSLYKYRIYMCIGTNLITLLETGQSFLFLCN